MDDDVFRVDMLMMETEQHGIAHDGWTFQIPLVRKVNL